MANVIAKIAGNQNQVSDVLSEYLEKIAPIIGPIMNPNEKAIPTKAIPLPRFFSFDTSVMMAILRDMLPLLNPPTKRASTKMAKFVDNAQTPYEAAMPNWKWTNVALKKMKIVQQNHRLDKKFKEHLPGRPS